MNENINVNTCENVNLNEGTTVTPKITMEQAKDAYVSGLQYDISKLENDLKNANLNMNRFQSLYCQSLSSLLRIKDVTEKKDVDAIKTILFGTFSELEKIEAKSIEESNI
jgi:hypothetical protein